MVAIERAKITEFALTENETETLPIVLTDFDLPAGMPLTNHLDKMTREQAVFSIRNGDAWLAYLKANGGRSMRERCRILFSYLKFPVDSVEKTINFLFFIEKQQKSKGNLPFRKTVLVVIVV